MANFAYPSGWSPGMLSATQGNTVAQEPSFWDRLGAASFRASQAGGGLGGLLSAMAPQGAAPAAPSVAAAQPAALPKPQQKQGGGLGGLGSVMGALKF